MTPKAIRGVGIGSGGILSARFTGGIGLVVIVAAIADALLRLRTRRLSHAAARPTGSRKPIKPPRRRVDASDMQPMFQPAGSHRAMTNAERQQAWRDRHRPRKRKPIVLLGPTGKPSPAPLQPFRPAGSGRAMTNAERQQRWRDTHRPRKRKAVVLLGPDGKPSPFQPFRS